MTEKEWIVPANATKKKMKCQNKIIIRSYIISQKELKKKLGLVGDIQEIGLLIENLDREEQEETNDKDEWEIVTHEVEE